MDSLTLLKKQHTKLKNQRNNIREQLEQMDTRELELESIIVKLTALTAEARMTPNLLIDKRKDLIKTVVSSTSLLTLLITSIVAGMGYTTELGFKINEIIIALTASSTISATSLSGLALYSYKSYSKDLVYEDPEELQLKLDEANNELNEIIEKTIKKETELKAINNLIDEIEEQLQGAIRKAIKSISQPQVEITLPEETFQMAKKFPTQKKQ